LKTPYKFVGGLFSIEKYLNRRIIINGVLELQPNTLSSE